MDELVKAIAEQTNLPEAQARKAAEAAVKFMKEKLPEPLAGQIDNLLESPGVADNAENLLNMGKSLFGKKK
ncbi:MAG: DUF2267 domain-containing protein [Chloroflexi bacterium]|nr:MAG: DUF2267 domain-containing protein [Chloroflexota bacterium]